MGRGEAEAQKPQNLTKLMPETASWGSTVLYHRDWTFMLRFMHPDADDSPRDLALYITLPTY
jgi:hypothetical protein